MTTLKRIAHKTYRLDRLYHNYLKLNGGNTSQLLALATALVNHNLIRVIFAPNGDFRYYYVVNMTDWSQKQKLVKILKAIISGTPFEDVTPESHLKKSTHSLDGADLGMLEDVDFYTKDSGTLVGVFIGTENVINQLSPYVIEDLEIEIESRNDSRRDASKLDLAITQAKEEED